MEKQKTEHKAEQKTFFNNNRFVCALVIIALSTLVLGAGAGILIANLSSNGSGDGRNKTTGGGLFSNEPKVEIKASETKNIQYEKFDNGLVSMQIPKGWKVQTNVNVLTYTIYAYDPSHTERMIFANLKSEGFNKSKDAQDWWNRYYPDTAFARMPIISPQTTEAFFKIYPQTHNLRANEADPLVNFIPNYTNFSVIQNLGKTILGGDLLRATYQLNNKKIQGLFTGLVSNTGSINQTKNIFDILGSQGTVDVWPLTVYDIFFFTAADDEFNDWQKILDKCIGTIEYSKEFMSQHAKALQNQSDLTKTLSKNASDISDGIMDSWNKRQTSYDITSQKQSDATLGYERVKDTETGEIYRATNGFTDSYNGTRYQSISDNDYTKGIDGYINLK